MATSKWDAWLDKSLAVLAARNLLRSPRHITLSAVESPSGEFSDDATFDGPVPSDRTSLVVSMEEAAFQGWLQELPTTTSVGSACKDVGRDQKELLLFTTNNYLALGAHPAVRNAAAKAAREYGMGPRSSGISCGYTDHHYKLEISLARLKNKEGCLLVPAGFGANMAFLAALGSVASLLAAGRKPCRAEKIAVFSDELNHGSIIDGLRLAERLQEAEVFVYKHCNMHHLDSLISSCDMEKKVVITDSLFSMDGDIAPLDELVALRRKHGFLLVVDDAHGTFIFGENGGGVMEAYGCEDDVDVCIGTLSKAAGCQGGFIACSNKWKQLIQSRGRSYIFSASLPVPVVAAAHAAIMVAMKEPWRRAAVWDRVRYFNSLTGLNAKSPIISVVIGDEESALQASRRLLESGLHIVAVRPPLVAPNSCRLRITLTCAHTFGDIERLVALLRLCTRLPTDRGTSVASKL